VTDILAQWSATSPDRPAIVMGTSGRVVTYAELDRRSTGFANWLRSQGLERGDGIAILMENRPEFMEAAWAAQRSGLYYTAINWHLQADELAYILADCEAQVLVTSAPMAPLVESLRGRTGSVRHVVWADGDAGLAFDDTCGGPTTPLADPAEGCELLYSSGTTGRPKAVKRPLPPPGELLANHVYARDMYRDRYHVTPESVYLSPAPLYHSAPISSCFTVHRLGATTLIMERYDAEQNLELIERHRVTHAQYVPTMFVRMLKLPEEVRTRYDLSSQRCAIHASAPCPIRVKEEMIRWWGPILEEYYSGTEGMGATTIDSVEWLAHPGSVGRPMGAVKIHIVDDDGNEVGPNETGRIFFESARQFEYLHDPEKTRSVEDSRGWRTLGDVGHVDEDGYLYLTDRATFMIISGGVNIYPQEIEDLLVTHPAVHDVAVFGVPNDEFGEEVKAVVQPAEGSVPSDGLAAELIEFARAHLAHYKAPRSIDFVDEVPRDPNGKLYKRSLRDRYFAGHGSKIL
jgi:acyl-CoA synthetase (AMP-forming)/AMP-acid ligase II